MKTLDRHEIIEELNRLGIDTQDERETCSRSSATTPALRVACAASSDSSGVSETRSSLTFFGCAGAFFPRDHSRNSGNRWRSPRGLFWRE